MRTKLLLLSAIAAACARAQQPAGLDAVRQYALHYVASLPDYTCSQVTQRVYSMNTRTSRDLIEEELNFVGGKEHYTVTKVNGSAPANKSIDGLSGPVSQGEFGSLLRHIFDPATGATFRAAGDARIQGRAMRVFTYGVPQAKGYSVFDGEIQRELLLPYEGRIFADAETNAVRRITMKCVGFPPETRLNSTELTLDYKPAELSGRSFILPSQAELTWSKRTTPRAGMILEEGTNTVEFKSYRRFTADSNIHF